MADAESKFDSPVTEAAHFATTHWTVVLRAGTSGHSQAGEALASLCRTYWYPLYAYVRRRGHSAHDAQDLTQEFFAKLLSKNSLASVDPKKGRFRSFLLASMNHFLANEWDRAKAQKRGGGQAPIPLDGDSAESRYGVEPAHEMTPEKYFEQRWALALLEEVLVKLRKEYTTQGKGPLFDQLKETLTAGRSSIPYAELGAKLSMTEGALKVAVHRLRHRYRDLLRAEISQTVANADEVDDEIRYLFAALSHR